MGRSVMRLQLRARFADFNRMRLGAASWNRALTSREVADALVGALALAGWGLLFARGFLWTGLAIGVVGIALFFHPSGAGAANGEDGDGSRAENATEAIWRYARIGIVALPGTIAACDWLMR